MCLAKILCDCSVIKTTSAWLIIKQVSCYVAYHALKVYIYICTF